MSEIHLYLNKKHKREKNTIPNHLLDKLLIRINVLKHLVGIHLLAGSEENDFVSARNTREGEGEVG